MESKLPLPTDSIYKFYALFGLLLFIFSIGATLYNTKSTNDLIFSTFAEYETLNSIENRTTLQNKTLEVIDRKIEIAISDKKLFLKILSVISALSIILMFYGFQKWHRYIQPIQDEMAQLQLEKLRHEVRILTQ